MFCKVNYNFDTPLYVITDGLKRFTGENGYGIDYKKIWSPDVDKLLSVLPKRYWQDFHLTVMTINRDIPPHTDTEIITTINFYLDAGGDNIDTVFYQPTVDDPNTFQIENQIDGYIFDKTQLQEIGRFRANPMECWVLDVKKIHSVEGSLTGVRKAVTLGTFVHSYDSVVEMFKETGCL
jgi:methionine synthase I (cobalamin-dependent)